MPKTYFTLTDRSVSVYWSATDFTGNDTTWYFTDDPDNLGGRELSNSNSGRIILC